MAPTAVNFHIEKCGNPLEIHGKMMGFFQIHGFEENDLTIHGELSRSFSPFTAE